MAIGWKQDLQAGDPRIDSHNRELIDRLDRLIETASRAADRIEVRRAFDSFAESVQAQFALEDQLMASSGFVSVDAHRREHERFVKRFPVLHEAIELHGPSLELTMKINAMLVDWLTGHIRRFDTVLGTHLRKRPSF